MRAGYGRTALVLTNVARASRSSFVRWYISEDWQTANSPVQPQEMYHSMSSGRCKVIVKGRRQAKRGSGPGTPRRRTPPQAMQPQAECSQPDRRLGAREWGLEAVGGGGFVLPPQAAKKNSPQKSGPVGLLGGSRKGWITLERGVVDSPIIIERRDHCREHPGRQYWTWRVHGDLTVI